MALHIVENDIKNLEFQTLKLPYEILNKKFRQTQKNVDREVMKMQVSIKELEKLLDTDSTEKVKGDKMEVEKKEESMEIDIEENKEDSKKEIEQIKQSMRTHSAKIVAFNKKLITSVKDEKTSAESIKTRLQHLDSCCQQLKQPEVAETALNTWKKKQLDKMLVDYFLRSGYYDTALKLSKSSGLEELSNMAAFSTFREIEDALDRRDISKCLAWCLDNKSKLRKIKSTLEMSLRQQEFVEMVKEGRKMEAVMYARKHFTTMDDPQYKDIQKCMGLLIFSADSTLSPYAHLLKEERWDNLKRLFRKESYRMNQLNEAPLLSLIMQIGLSSLKTPVCFASEKKGAVVPKSRKTNCPVCTPVFKTLASKLPYALFSHSRLICYGSGEAMNEHNLPLMLPNGYAYGSNYLTAMAEKNDGQVTCPRTNETFALKDSLKVFIM